MAGNSQRKGAIRKASTKKSPIKGTGGKNKRSLEGKGPTPRAEERPNHKAFKRKQREEYEASKKPQTRGAKPKPRDRTSGSLELVIGRNSTLEALRYGIPATILYVFDRIDADDRITEIVGLAVDAGIEVKEVPRGVLDGMADGSPHQGVALEVPSYQYRDHFDLMESPGPIRILALDSIQDPRNLGAIMRSAGAFGAAGLVIPERRAAGVTVAAWKVSAGAAARVPVARATNLVRALKDFQDAGFFVVGLDAGGDVALQDSNLLGENIVIVIGSEGSGLSRLVRDTCDQIASIPIHSATESLNASVAASIALYELSRANRSS
jgi:23S rRNA (guanosine2251-2'-O)-methyltransferase